LTVELVIKRTDKRGIRVSPQDAEEIDLETGDIARAMDEVADESCVGMVHIDPSVEKGTVEMDTATINSLYSEEGNEVVLELFEGELREVDQITFGVEPRVGQNIRDMLIFIKDNEDQLLKFINGRAIVIGQKFIWDPHDISLEISETDPMLGPDEVALVTEEVLEGFDYQSTSTSVPFDAVLLMDVSGSMERSDIRVDNVGQILSHLKDGYNNPFVSDFVGTFDEGARVRRYDAAALSGLIYLSEKIGRGKGERLGIVSFTGEANTITFNDKEYFEAGVDGDIEYVAQEIIRGIAVAHGRTNLSAGLQHAVHLADLFGNDKIKMFVILTDGHPTKPDSPETVFKYIDENIVPRKDILINAAGIGDSIDESFLRDVTKKCRGSYIRVRDLNRLISWYGDLARNLKMKRRFAIPSGTRALYKRFDNLKVMEDGQQ